MGTQPTPLPEQRDAGAVMLAVQMLRQPDLARAVRRAPLPRGMTFLLEVAAGDADALSEAERLTGDASHRLREAAGFFVEQVMFTEWADHYRVLGVHRDAGPAELRHHMALLMRWLHPDARADAALGQFDRGVFVTRITGAWQALKTSDGRAAYDAALPSRSATRVGGRSIRHGSQTPRSSRSQRRRWTVGGLLGRLFFFLKGRR